MRPDTAAALNRINLDFYERRAASFAEKRSAPWPGWQRVADEIERRRADTARRPSVLDLGCGHGRLAGFLDHRWRGGFDYLGLDASGALLDLAAAREWRARCRFLRHDLVREGLPGDRSGGSFELVCAFGLMHHVAGFDNRRSLLGAAARAVAPRGLLAVSFWQFGAVERFRRRVVPWETYNRTAAEPIDPRDLEEGDALLAWGEARATAGRPAPVRYCHWARPEEADRLLAALALDPVASFRADGRAGDLNLYRLLRRS